MGPRALSDALVRPFPELIVDDSVARAVTLLLESDLAALPVVDASRRLRGVFGEREFFKALFPGYLSEMHSAGFVPRSLERVLEKRANCGQDAVGAHLMTEHVDLGPDFSDAGVAETFLHHRVLIVPITDEGRVTGVISRADFFRATAGRFLDVGA